MTRYVLDTNMVSLVLRGDRQVRARLEAALVPENWFLGCPLVWYELRRGLLAKDAKRQMQRFEALFDTFAWDDVSRDDWALAATWWARRRAAGLSAADVDLLIAAFARNRRAVVVTQNEKDFVGLDVMIENWAR